MSSPAGHLRAVRLSAGLSQRELARLSGVSQPTLSALEAGRDPQLSTLQRLADVLPELDPRELLGSPGAGPRPASRSAWEWTARALGFRFEHVCLHVDLGEDGAQHWALDVRGIRAPRASLEDDDARTSLMRAACAAPPRLLSAISSTRRDLERGEHVIADEGARHVFSFPRDLARRGLSYSVRASCGAEDAAPPHFELPWERPFRRGAAFWVQAPIRRLRLSVRLPRSAVGPDRVALVRHHAWPAAVRLERDAERDAWRDLHPGAPAEALVARSGRAELVVERPVLGPCYGISWDEEADAPSPAPGPPGSPGPPGTASTWRRRRLPGVPSSPETPGGEAGRAMASRSRHRGDGGGAASGARVAADAVPATAAPGRTSVPPRRPEPREPHVVLAEARRRAGLPVRELAARAGISAASVSAVEHGRDVFVSTVRALLGALPDVSPFELLDVGDGPPIADAARAWERQRDLFGLEAEEEDRLGRVDREGHVRYVARTVGLRCSRPLVRGMLLRHGLEVARHVKRSHVLSRVAVSSSSEDAQEGSKVRVVRRDAGPLIHDVRLHAGEHARVVTYERELVVGRRVALRKGERRPSSERGPEWPADAVWVAPLLPARRLRLELRFPRGLLPRDFVTRVVPQAFLPRLAGSEDLGPRVHGSSMALAVERRRCRAVLEVERPLVGLQYAIGWRPG